MSTVIQDSLLKELGVSESMDFFYIHPFLNKKGTFSSPSQFRWNLFIKISFLIRRNKYECDKEKPCHSTLIRLQLVELLILLSRIYNEIKSSISETYNKENESQLLVQRICGYLTRNYDQKVSIPTLCKLFNISPRHLSRLFKQETGKTVIEMVHYIRIEKAKTLLLESNDKVINVALRVGYDDSAFFSRLF